VDLALNGYDDQLRNDVARSVVRIAKPHDPETFD
jgi:hypothetical protein